MTPRSSQRDKGEEPDTQEMAKVVGAALAKGRSEQEIVEELVQAGWPLQTAKDFVREAIPVGRFTW